VVLVGDLRVERTSQIALVGVGTPSVNCSPLAEEHLARRVVVQGFRTEITAHLHGPLGPELDGEGILVGVERNAGEERVAVVAGVGPDVAAHLADGPGKRRHQEDRPILEVVVEELVGAHATATVSCRHSPRCPGQPDYGPPSEPRIFDTAAGVIKSSRYCLVRSKPCRLDRVPSADTVNVPVRAGSIPPP
jgi:hypothetical protein